MSCCFCLDLIWLFAYYPSTNFMCLQLGFLFAIENSHDNPLSIAAICDDLICLYVFEYVTCLHHPSIFLSSFRVCCCCYCWPLSSFAINVIRWDPASFHICWLSHFIGCCVCHFYSFVLFIYNYFNVSFLNEMCSLSDSNITS